MILLKRDSNTDFSSEYSEIFNTTYFQVEALENEIYSCFLMSEVIYTPYWEKERRYAETLLQSKVQCKILI